MGRCRARCGPFRCNRYKGHEGRHKDWGGAWYFEWESRKGPYMFAKWFHDRVADWFPGSGCTENKESFRQAEKEYREALDNAKQ